MSRPNEAAVRSKGVLHPWQRRLYAALLGALGLMAANSIYLVAFTKISSFFMAMLLMHLVLGSLIAVPFLLFALTHGPRMFLLIRNNRAKAAGVTILTLALVAIGTGVYMALEGATLTHRAVYVAHVAAVPLALVAFVLHRRAAVHKLAFSRLGQWGGAVVAFLLVMTVLHKLERPPKRIVNTNGDTQFFLSSAETFDQGLMDGKKLAANEYCAECHQVSFERWKKGAHRFSSFNNPFYRRSVELAADRVGREKTKWCAGCHDPVVLFTGQMGKATLQTFTYDQFEAQQGLACMACHSITEVKDLRGNGGYVIEESKQYPFTFTKSKVLHEVNKLLIRMEPSLHRQTFMKPFMRTPEFCAACHKVALLPPFNEYHWMRGQNHYDGWYDSGVSGNAVRSFYEPPKPKACRDCHLPLIPSKEFGARDGKVHDHLFPAANTALPAVRGEADTIKDVQKVLEGSLTVDLFAIKRGGAAVPLGPDLPKLRPGERVDLETVVRTRTVGHPFTNGTSDSNEVWVELHAELVRPDGTKAPLLTSGTLDADGRLDPAADRLSQVVIDHEGGLMDRRQPQDIHVALFHNFIPPGADRTVHYRFTVPADAKGRVALSASLNYRKFSRDYSIFVGGEKAPALPVTRIATDAVVLKVLGGDFGAPQTPRAIGDGADEAADPKAAMAARGNKDGNWLRFNDYGIGLLLQGDLKGAGAAFTKASELAPDKPDGPLNLARARIQEGDLPAAKAALAEAEKRRPGWPKTAFFRSLVSKEEGRVEDALADALRVDAKFPKDRTNLNGIARLLYVAGKYAEALPYIDRVLAIDSEDLAAHYNAMLCLKALGRREEAAAEELWYRYFKDDESARAVTAAWRRGHPWDNRESLPIHVHDDAVPPPAPKPSWLAEIGPKGYAYKGAAPPNEMVLHDDRPRGAKLPLARPEDVQKSARLLAALPPVAFAR